MLEHCPWNLIFPLIWLETTEASQVTLQRLVDPLRLAVRLRMIGRAKIEFRPLQFEEFHPKSTQENSVPVTYIGSRVAIETYDLFQEYLGDPECSVGVLQYHKVSKLGESINSLPMARGQPSTKSIDTSSHTLSGSGNGLSRPGGAMVSPLFF